MPVNLLSYISLAVAVTAQSPSGFEPHVQAPLAASYGNTHVFAGMRLPQSVPTLAPAVFAGPHEDAKYMLLLVDISVPVGRQSLAHRSQVWSRGISEDHTNRLHWWQADVRLASPTSPSALTFDPDTVYAPYVAPDPHLGDAPHKYVFWLFPQPDHHAPPSRELQRAWSVANSRARLNFSLDALAVELGQPVAATYFVTEHAGNARAVTKPGYLLVQQSRQGDEKGGAE